MRSAMTMLAVGLLLGGCARTPPAPPPPPVAPLGSASPNQGLSPAGSLWHLRSAMNVAALKCGEDVRVSYNAFLLVQRRALARAEQRLVREYRRAGGDWRDRFDDRMTQVYNYFARVPGEELLCYHARDVLPRVREAAPGDLDALAARTLVAIDRAFAAAPAPTRR